MEVGAASRCLDPCTQIGSSVSYRLLPTEASMMLHPMPNREEGVTLYLSASGESKRISSPLSASLRVGTSPRKRGEAREAEKGLPRSGQIGEQKSK